MPVKTGTAVAPASDRTSTAAISAWRSGSGPEPGSPSSPAATIGSRRRAVQSAAIARW